MHVEAHDLVKTYPQGVRALDGLSITVAARRGVRPARPERRRQVDRHQDPHHAGPPRLRHRHRRRTRRARHPDRVRRVIGVVAQRSGADPLATGRTT